MSDNVRSAVAAALASGALIRPAACSKCGEVKLRRHDGGPDIQGHHDDYNKPLIVRWLCLACHRKWHTKNRAIARRPRPISTFSDLLKRYRDLRGFTVAELAESSGVQARTIRRLEAGQDGMKGAAVVSLCTALNVDEVAAMRWLRPDLS